MGLAGNVVSTTLQYTEQKRKVTRTVIEQLFACILVLEEILSDLSTQARCFTLMVKDDA